MKVNIKQVLQQGVTAHKEGKLHDAERFYRTIIKSQPSNPDANHNLGVLAVSVNKTDEAISLFKIALEANPKIEQFWLSYIDALIKEKQFQNAKQVLEQAKKENMAGDRLNVLEAQLAFIDKPENTIRLSPSQAQLNTLLEHYQNQRFDNAEKLSVSITQEFPKNQFAWKVLGAILVQTGRDFEAVNAIQTAVLLSPQDAELHYNLGNPLHKLGRLDEAEASYRQAIALKPDFAEAHTNLGITLQELSRLDEAEASYRQAIALKPDYAEAHYNLGITLQELGRLDEVEASYRQAIALKPDYALAHNNLGARLQELGRTHQAEVSLRQAIALKPDYANAYYNLANTLKELDRLDDAEASYRQAIVLKPNKFVDAYDQLVLILQKKRKFDEAEVFYIKCMSLDPNRVSLSISKGSILFKEGLYEQALRTFENYNDVTSKAEILETLYALGRVDDIYARIEARADLDDKNIRVASIAAFLAEREKKDTAHKFCNNPIEFIYFTNISSHIKDSEKFSLSVIEELQNVKTKWELNTTQNGFQANVDVFKNPLEKMSILKSIIIDEIDTYYSKFKNESCSYIKKWPSERNINGWHVVLKQQGHQTAHIHPTGWLSGVIYLMVVPSLENNEGAIEFSLDGPNYTHSGSSKKIYQPKLGDIVFFPSSLHHRTLPFSTDMDRICVSFDLMPT